MPEIYLSYDRKDKPYADRLRTGLKPALRQFQLSIWSRDDIPPAAEWKKEMKKHLEHTAFFVQLATAQTLASDMCYIEAQAALYRAQHDEIKIISILVAPCEFEFSLLASHAFVPASGKFITLHSNQDKAWLDVQRELLAIINGNQRYLDGNN